jgi:aconitase A
MHQINLEKMSPVIQAQDGVAFPDTCVGTDSHTPHVDALGVIAIGVGGLEAENVMLGRASWMRLPDIVGVRADRQAPARHHRHRHRAGPDRVSAQVEGGRRLSGVLRRGRRQPHDRRPRHHLQHGPEYGATAAMFYIDSRPSTTCKLTGREPEQVALVETYAKTTGLWADALATAEYERVLEFDLSTVVRNMAGPSNPHPACRPAPCTSAALPSIWTRRWPRSRRA